MLIYTLVCYQCYTLLEVHLGSHRMRTVGGKYETSRLFFLGILETI